MAATGAVSVTALATIRENLVRRSRSWEAQKCGSLLSTYMRATRTSLSNTGTRAKLAGPRLLVDLVGQPTLGAAVGAVERLPALQRLALAGPHRFDRIQRGLVDSTRSKERHLVVRVREDGSAAAVVEGHDDLERSLGQAPGVVGADHEVGKLINQVHATFHWFTSDWTDSSRLPAQASRSEQRAGAICHSASGLQQTMVRRISPLTGSV